MGKVIFKKLVKVGSNSLCVIIHKALCDYLDLKEGDKISFEIKKIIKKDVKNKNV